METLIVSTTAVDLVQLKIKKILGGNGCSACQVVKETLVKSGVLPEIKARIRAEVFNVLQDNSESPPPLSNENLVINELIREYLIFNGYSYTESVLMAESGQPRLPLDKEFLQQQLQIKPNRDSANIPLLYSLVSYFMKENKPSSSIVAPHSPPSKLRYETTEIFK